MFLLRIIDLYSLIVLAAVVSNWLPVPAHHPVVRFLRAVTEPVLEPIRKILPQSGNLDFSPIVLLLGLQLLRRLFFF